ncbi:hypothetical protein [Marinobacter sp.]|uniref:hypothetical protein n=1 Tax=Marinobacter sp. TaxID=50741 RepID=UPI003566E735
MISNSAYKGSPIGVLPINPRNRNRIGDELQPVGTYADVNPYQLTIQDIEAVQDHERAAPDFKDKDWWWDHQSIRFLNGKLGFKFLVLAIPFAWITTLVVGGLALAVSSVVRLTEFYELPASLYLVLLATLVPGWLIFSLWIVRPTTNWIMSKGIAVLIRPFEKVLNKKLDETLEDGCSEFNRTNGKVRFALGRGRIFEAPFVEFDAYVERIVQQGGIFYRLMLVHRYTQRIFNKTSISSIEAEKSEVLALWDMLQRYMDVTQPLPDVPRLEPFRHLDPVTREHDEKTGRNPRYWRDLDIEAWKHGGGVELLNRLRSYPWGSRVCKLTPQLGKVSLEEYRGMRPEGAWPI